MSPTDQVLSEFIDAWNAGERPRVRDYLARLPDGPDRDALASGLASWLETAPTPTYSDATRAAIASEPSVARLFAEGGLWPAIVPELRARAGLSLADLASRVIERFSLPRADAPRTEDYLMRLESGALDPSRVSRRLLDAVGGFLGVPGGSLSDSATFSRALRPAGAALFRAEGDAAEQIRHDIELLSKAALSSAPAPMDDLDRLFTGGPEA